MKADPTYASAREYLQTVGDLLDELPEQSERLVDLLYQAFERGSTVFLVGNGGSAANASHFGQDLAKGTLDSMAAERRFRVIPLTDNVGYITALANDEGYESVFEQQLRNLARPGDVLIAISGSGKSPNVLRAAEYARSVGMTTIAVTGFDGGALRSLADASVNVPVNDMGMAEALHGVVFHLVTTQLRARLASAGP